MEMGERKAKLRELVGNFNANIKQYKSPIYDEANIRVDYIDKFFEVLGWDVRNEQGFSEDYREVVREDKVIIEGKPKAPDYSFRIGGKRIFFVEAKKPAVKIKEEINPAFQLRRYAYSAKFPLSILTDFEEFSVYDTRIKPHKNDKASTARTFYCTFDEYEKHFDFIYKVFSKTAVLKGSFDSYIKESKAKRGTSEVDKEILKMIETWRNDLARNIALRNKKLDVYNLNYTVQKIIDRILFLRIAEDRHMEKYGVLASIINENKVYKKLDDVFNKANSKYNSSLFRVEKWLENIKIDDKVLSNIIHSLYYPECPYELSVLPIEILGNIYEQFLGKTIHLTPSHHAKVEEKPEVRKAGGVYYTPQYIVDYIVEHTIGEKIKGKKPEEISSLKILDPACGSGSFLVGVFQYLIDYHLRYYTQEKNIKKVLKRGNVYQIETNTYHLSIKQKQRILLNNIYGVDIDSQAVEVTKLSLLLKLMEGEHIEGREELFKHSDFKLLPDLSSNIKCGNSLIGSDFYDNKQLSLFDKDGIRKINAFDWEKEFAEVIKKGGFDVVLGNPPYGFHQIHAKNIKPYYKKHFISTHGSYEHYFLFYEKTLKLLRDEGRHGFIVPVTWLTIPSAKSLRKFILDNYSIQEINWLPELVFKDAKVNTLISIIQKSKPLDVKVNIYDSLGFKETPIEQRVYRQQKFKYNGYFIGIFEGSFDTEIINKINKFSKPLFEIASPCSGYNPYEVGKGQSPKGGVQTKEDVKNKPYHSNKKINDIWKPEIVGRELDRYNINIAGERWIKYGPWLAAARDPNNFRGKRILVQEITGGKDKRIVAAYYDGELYHSRDIIPIKIEKRQTQAYYLLAIINSKLISWYHHKKNPKAQKKLFPKVLVSDLKKIPIRVINFNDVTEKAQHDKMVSLVDQMLEAQKELHKAKTDADKDICQKKVDLLDKQIDQLAYELYELTEEEIKIVEGNQ